MFEYGVRYSKTVEIPLVQREGETRNTALDRGSARREKKKELGIETPNLGSASSQRFVFQVHILIFY